MLKKTERHASRQGLTRTHLDGWIVSSGGEGQGRVLAGSRRLPLLWDLGAPWKVAYTFGWGVERRGDALGSGGNGARWLRPSRANDVDNGGEVAAEGVVLSAWAAGLAMVWCRVLLFEMDTRIALLENEQGLPYGDVWARQVEVSIVVG